MDKLIASFEAKTKFSHVISDVADKGINYIVTKRGKPVAIIKPYLADESRQGAINSFLQYRNLRKLELGRDNTISDITHYKHRYYERSSD